jgi:dihydrofolate synthase/folylpolyglutamate synthase
LPRLTYDQLVAELFPRLTGGIRWGLDRTRRILEADGNPHHRFRSIHVGGTNGKGSVAAHIESVLRHDGRRVGLYTSPHLCTFRERIRIAGHVIDEDALLRAAARLWPVIQEERPSFFEATTAMAFAAFADADIDIAVIEVGLGGRLDATNVITPDVVALTNVSLDHVQLLGDTLQDVAREKAGIIKAGVPVVTADSGVGLEVFTATAAELNAPLHRVAVHAARAAAPGTTFTVHTATWGELTLRTPLLGSHQALNAALAVTALDVLTDARPAQEAVRRGIDMVRWPGRLQRETIAGATWLFDVAHNVAGVEALIAALGEIGLHRPIVAVVGVLGDKDWSNMLAPLHAAADRVILTSPPTAPAERRWNPTDALRAAPSERAEIIEDFTLALDRARVLAGAGGTVVVTGSFHTVGDAMAVFGLCSDGADFEVTTPPVI